MKSGAVLPAHEASARGLYDGFYIPGAGNNFIGCRVTYNGAGSNPAFNQVKNAFETNNGSSTETNYFEYNYVQSGCFTNADYVFSGTQTQSTVISQTNLYIPGRGVVRVRGDVVVDNNVSGAASVFWIRDSNAGTDAKNWAVRVNDPSNLNQILYSIFSDNLTTETVYLRVTRSGTTVSLIELLSPLVATSGSLSVNGNMTAAGQAIFSATGALIAVGSGSPNGVVTAVGGSLYLDGGGNLWVKTSGVGNTGWTQALTTASGVNAVQIQGISVSATAPTTGQVLEYNGSQWIPTTPSTGGFSAGAWTAFTPSTSNLTSVTIFSAAYNVYGKTCFFRIHLQGTTSGSAPGIGLPFTPVNTGQTFACTYQHTSVGAVSVSGSTMLITQANGSSLPSAATDFIISGAFETT